MAAAEADVQEALYDSRRQWRDGHDERAMLRANEQRREAVEDAVRRAEVERRNRSGAVSHRGCDQLGGDRRDWG